MHKLVAPAGAFAACHAIWLKPTIAYFRAIYLEIFHILNSSDGRHPSFRR